jgi:hypothetical protein
MAQLIIRRSEVRILPGPSEKLAASLHLSIGSPFEVRGQVGNGLGNLSA